MRRVSPLAVSRWSRSLGCCGFRCVFWVRQDLVFFFPLFFFFERTRPAASTYEAVLPSFPLYQILVMRPFSFPIGQKRLFIMRPVFAYRQDRLFIPGCVQGVIILFVCLSVCVCLCVCVTFVVFTVCESSTKPISTSPGSMEASEYGLTRGTCFVARRLEVGAVSGLLWISWWCVLGAAGFFFFRFFSL